MPSSSTARRHLGLVATTNGALPRYLFKRKGVYYFKRKTPVDVAHGFPEYKEQVWKTLDTSWLEAAKVSLAVETGNESHRFLHSTAVAKKRIKLRERARKASALEPQDKPR